MAELIIKVKGLDLRNYVIGYLKTLIANLEAAVIGNDEDEAMLTCPLEEEMRECGCYGDDADTIDEEDMRLSAKWFAEQNRAMHKEVMAEKKFLTTGGIVPHTPTTHEVNEAFAAKMRLPPCNYPGFDEVTRQKAAAAGRHSIDPVPSPRPDPDRAISDEEYEFCYGMKRRTPTNAKLTPCSECNGTGEVVLLVRSVPCSKGCKKPQSETPS